MADNDGFLSRWSRRKVQVQQGLPVAPAPDAKPEPEAESETDGDRVATPAPARPATIAPAAIAPGQALAEATPATSSATEARVPPPPTLEEAQLLTPADDFSRFVGRGVDPQVKNTALKTLFSDPHFNVMDGLDIYIGDYNTPDPLPAGMLQQMAQSAMLRLFETEADPPRPPGQAQPADAAAIHPTEPPPLHEDPALRLQPNDDAGPAGDQPGPVEDPGRQQ